MTAPAASPVPAAFERLPRDLSPYREGNVGIPYVHRFHSGRPGPHVLVNALTHGNEFCGVVAATHLLDAGIRPRVGALIQHGLHGTPGHHGVALVAECGGHFRRASGELATAVALDFRAHFGLIERQAGEPWSTGPQPQQRSELLQTWVIKTGEFRFTRPLVGFETFQRGELVATDGQEEVRAPCDDCTGLMPTRKPVPGREGVYLARPLG